MGQVSGSIFRWDGSTEDFIQEESYHVPDMVKMEFQVAQGQLAWLAGRGQETSDHVALVEWELKCLWVLVVRATLLFGSQHAMSVLLALSNPCWTLPIGCSLVHRGRVESTINLYPAKGKVMAMSAATTSLEWPD